MSSLMVPSFYSATPLAQHPTAAAFTEAAPWRRILAVEPDITVLYAKSLLLTQADYCVTRASSDRDLFNLRGTKAVAVAILSDHLGPRLLGTVSETIRRQWPRTRILILGQVPGVLDDFLYDEHICRFPKPQQVLDELESLYKGMWNRRSNMLDWHAARSPLSIAHPPVAESHPAKTNKPARPADRISGYKSSDIRLPSTQHN